MLSSKAPLSLGILLSLLAAILFATKAIFVKLIYQQFEIGSTYLLLLRMLISLPFFVVIALFQLQKDSAAWNKVKKYKFSLIIYGLMGYYVASWFDFEGLKYMDASLERILIFIYPTIVVLLSYFWLGIKVSRVQLVTIAVCYFGIILAYYGNASDVFDPQIFKGSIFVFISALTYAIYLVGSQKVLSNMNSVLYNAMAMCAASSGIILHYLFMNGFDLYHYPSELYLLVCLMAVFSTVVPSFCMVKGIQIIGANTNSILGCIGPISTIIMASIILDEKIGLLQLIGSLIVVGGVLLLILYKKKEKEAVST